MSVHLPHAHHTMHALKTATEHGGAKGALAGAVGVAGSVATAAALGGLALTPVGWAVFGTAGAIAGGTGLLKKAREKFR